ncbi:hypothetical protein [Nocardia sputi]|uniref:hypothetical protein n=1 Tax=Nocardia sputi TaxID=2943705 RepID=UPI0020BF264C|nr:hypothetical protein [Nocardia sputi]
MTPTLGIWLANAEELLIRRVIAKNTDPLVFYPGNVIADRNNPHLREQADAALREPVFFELAKKFGEIDRLVTDLDIELDKLLGSVAVRLAEIVPSQTTSWSLSSTDRVGLPGASRDKPRRIRQDINWTAPDCALPYSALSNLSASVER